MSLYHLNHRDSPATIPSLRTKFPAPLQPTPDPATSTILIPPLGSEGDKARDWETWARVGCSTLSSEHRLVLATRGPLPPEGGWAGDWMLPGDWAHQVGATRSVIQDCET